MLNEDLGADIDKTVVLKAPPYTAADNSASIEAFRNQAMSNAHILGMAQSNSIPGTSGYSGNLRMLTDPAQAIQQVSHLMIDEYYLNLFQIKMAAGRGYAPEFNGDEGRAIVVNEKAAKVLGYVNAENLIGKSVVLNRNDTLQVVGVTQNYHHRSLQQEFEPMAFELSTLYTRYFSLKVNTSDINKTLSQMELAWQTHLEGNVFDFFFADDHFNEQYQSEMELQGIVTAFSTIAILIACLGLFALSLFTMMNKTKEIGVRKVLGAPVKSLFWSLSKDLLILIGISAVLATPIAYFLVSNWLDSFANRIGIHFLYVIFPIAAIMLLTILTVSFNVMKCLRVNPVESLRSE